MNRTKRQAEDDQNWPQATLLNALTGGVYKIDSREKFMMGRSFSCAVSLLEPFVSSFHCEIVYIGNCFYLVDKTSTNGTYLNCKLLSKATQSHVALEHGDLIGFSDKREMKCVYKFCWNSRSSKSSRQEEFRDVEEHPQPVGLKDVKKDFMQTLDHLYVEVINLKVEKTELKSQFKDQISKFPDMMETFFDNIKAEVLEIQDNNNKKSSQQLSTTTNDIQQRIFDAVRSFKREVQELMEKDCQCPICNEVILKAHTTNCSHVFCECCIKKWMEKSRVCPSCRSDIVTTCPCLSVDEFLTSLCTLLGGSAKYHRDNLIQERTPRPVQQNKPPIPSIAGTANSVIRFGSIHPRRRLRYIPIPVGDEAPEVIDLTDPTNL